MSGSTGEQWNVWLGAAAVLLVLGLPPGLAAGCRGTPPQRLAGLALTGTTATVVLLLAARGFGRSGYEDLGLVLAVLGPVGVLVFARVLGRPQRSPARPGKEGDGGSP
ncbi:multisubunit Na+/H+ antiporter MnhF subunit [Streptomyces sp. 3211.6]|uniref:MrpF/PhaF family protein n=1 Tax=Streptomyces sp. 3211.6 TaxID=1938845 RepID=UPI000EB45EF7|nr:MrpF/PhaF family protein [Streptomyces sp. 3211.6]RKT07950.1 multisubunit Na+/H+ antiporter MnhF subunit [Streptomyces sp. 3211.6]